MVLQHWRRPWAWLAGADASLKDAKANDQHYQPDVAGWVCFDAANPLKINDRVQRLLEDLKPHSGLIVSVLPLPKRIDVPEHFELGQTRLRIDFSKLPERPRGQADPASEEHQRGHADGAG